MKTIGKVVMWFFVVLVVLFILLMIIRAYNIRKYKKLREEKMARMRKANRRG